jgi:Helix-hairpin-helix motif
MRRAVGAVVVMGIMCLGNLLGEWTVRIHPSEGNSSATLQAEDTLPASRTESPTLRAPVHRASSSPPRSFHDDPLGFLSTAPADSLDLLPGIGPVLARRIIEARRARGSFTSWNDVLAVRGIGPRLVARWSTPAGGQ